MRAAQPMRADTVGADMIFLPLALDSITGDTTVNIALIIVAATTVGGFVIGISVSRALHGETLKRHDDRIKKLEGLLETSPPALNAEAIKEIKSWKQEATSQLQELETHRRVEIEVAVREERSASGSTARGNRPKTGSRKKVDP
jgi:hypothetical protein